MSAADLLSNPQRGLARGRIAERAFKVASGLGVVVGTIPTGSVTSCNGQWVEEFSSVSVGFKGQQLCRRT
jgi:hypothetical protein